MAASPKKAAPKKATPTATLKAEAPAVASFVDASPEPEADGGITSVRRLVVDRMVKQSSSELGPMPTEPYPPLTPRRNSCHRGVTLARLRRLDQAGFGQVDRCSLLGTPLDIGPRANPWQHPHRHGGDVVSELAMVIVESGVPPEALERAASILRAIAEVGHELP